MSAQEDHIDYLIAQGWARGGFEQEMAEALRDLRERRDQLEASIQPVWERVITPKENDADAAAIALDVIEILRPLYAKPIDSVQNAYFLTNVWESGLIPVQGQGML